MTTMTIAEAEAALRDARAAWYATLPAFPADGVCVNCGRTWDEYGSVQRMEHGYERWTNGQIEEVDGLSRSIGLIGYPVETSVVHWSTDGWDDMSEQGDFEYVQCNGFNGGCGQSYQLPEEEAWD